jgi:translation initiation factor IF-3
VEIAATATPPVCRIMNSGKFFYQQSKRDAEARKHQRHIQVKEVKFRPKIDEHDFQFKLRNAERFLSGGNKVKSVVIYRGREVVHMEVGRRHLERLASELSELCNVESPPKREGNTMVQILAPKKDGAGKKAVKKAGAAKKGEGAGKGTAEPKAKAAKKAPTPEKAEDDKKAAAPEKAEDAKKAAAPKKTEDAKKVTTAKEADGADEAAPPAKEKAGKPAEAASAAGKNE